LRDTIDPNAPFDTRMTAFLDLFRQSEGAQDAGRPAVLDSKLVERALDEALDALTNAAETQLRMIDAALARMVDGQYGYCDCCGRGIELERLEQMPATLHCNSCDR